MTEINSFDLKISPGYHQALYFSTWPDVFIFLLNTHLLLINLLPSSSVRRYQVSFFLKDSISSSMAFFQSSPFVELNASLIVFGSFFVVDNAKYDQKLGGLILSGCFLSWLDILTTGICSLTSSFDSVDPSKSWFPLFKLNSRFYVSFCLLTSSF